MDRGIEATANIVSDWIVFSVLAVVELFILIKMRFKIDISGTLTLFFHLFVSLIRLISTYVDSNLAVQKVLTMTGQNMIAYSLYYFTCELMHIRNSLESNDHLIYQKQRNLIQIIKHGSFLIVLLNSTYSSAQQYIRNTNMKFYKENLAYFNVGRVISRSIKICLDIYFHIKFLQLFIYLGRKSREKGDISRFQKFIKFFILFLYLVGLFQAVQIYYSTFAQILDPNYFTSSFYKFYRFTGQNVFRTKDFFIALLFCYLYYKQGKKRQILKQKEGIKARDNVLQHLDSLVQRDETRTKVNQLQHQTSKARSKQKHHIEQNNQFNAEYLETDSRDSLQIRATINEENYVEEGDKMNDRSVEILGAQFNELMNSLQNQKDQEFQMKRKGSSTTESDSLVSIENKKQPGLFQNAMFHDFIIKEVIRDD